MTKNIRDIKIANRESWFRIIIISIFTVLLTYKIITTPFNFTDLKFMDFLNLILALFAMGMSLAFYFKANETSNQFYDNTYNFTQDMSEILGRIESGFGERLKHLDEGYTGFLKRFESLAKVEKEIKEEETKVEQTEQEKEKLLSNLMNRAKIATEEQKRILDSLRKKDRELEEAKNELNFLRHNLANIRPRGFSIQKPGLRSAMRQILSSNQGKELILPPQEILSMSASSMRDWFRDYFLNKNKNAFLQDLLTHNGVVSPNGSLTDYGVDLLKDVVLELMQNR